jgi:hypothetical protein
MPVGTLSLKHRLFRRISPWVGTRIPDAHIYRVSLGMGRVFGRFVRREGARSDYRDGCSLVLGLCLREFAHLGRAFDLPLSVHGLDHVVTAYNQHRRLLLLSLHLPLNLCVHRALFPLRIPVTLVTNMARSAAWPVCGIPEVPQPTFASSGPSLYFQVRSALARERIVISLFDSGYKRGTIRLTSGPIQFAARSHTPVVLFASALDPDGAVRLVFSQGLSSDFLQDRGACLDEIATFIRPFVGEHDRFRWRKRYKSGKAA